MKRYGGNREGARAFPPKNAKDLAGNFLLSMLAAAGLESRVKLELAMIVTVKLAMLVVHDISLQDPG